MKPSSRRFLYILGSLAAVASWAAYELYTGRQMEDSWITFRYARNILEGNGMVFNIGERVLGTTTPLFTLLLTAPGVILGHEHLQLIGDIASILSCLATAWLIFLSFRRYGESLALITTGVFVFNPITMWIASGGMETALVVFLMALLWWASNERDIVLSGGTAALLVLARPDTLVWIGLVSLGLLLKTLRSDSPTNAWRYLSKWLLAFVLIVSPWLLFAWFYFGSPIPHTLSAKLTIDAAHRDISIASVGEVLQLAGIGTGVWSINSILQVTLFLVGTYFISLKRNVLLWVFPIYSVVFSAVLYFGNAPFADWYWVPCKWTSMIVVVFGCHYAAECIGKVILKSDSWIAIPLGVMLISYSAYLTLSSAPHYEAYQQVERQTREQTGMWLRDSTPGNASVLTEAIGYIGYFSERPIIDLAGLVSPGVVDLAKTTNSNAQLFSAILRHHKPDYIILRSNEVRDNAHYHGGNLFESSADWVIFRSKYREIREFRPDDVWGETRAFTIFARQ
jgi:hypothetical protein